MERKSTESFPKWSLVLFDTDGCTMIVKTSSLTSDGELAEGRVVQTEICKDLYQVEILRMADSKAALNAFEIEWSNSTRSEAISAAKDMNVNGGYLAMVNIVHGDDHLLFDDSVFDFMAADLNAVATPVRDPRPRSPDERDVLLDEVHTLKTNQGVMMNMLSNIQDLLRRKIAKRTLLHKQLYSSMPSARPQVDAIPPPPVDHIPPPQVDPIPPQQVDPIPPQVDPIPPQQVDPIPQQVDPIPPQVDPIPLQQVEPIPPPQVIDHIPPSQVIDPIVPPQIMDSIPPSEVIDPVPPEVFDPMSSPQVLDPIPQAINPVPPQVIDPITPPQATDSVPPSQVLAPIPHPQIANPSAPASRPALQIPEIVDAPFLPYAIDAIPMELPTIVNIGSNRRPIFVNRLQFQNLRRQPTAKKYILAAMDLVFTLEELQTSSLEGGQRSYKNESVYKEKLCEDKLTAIYRHASLLYHVSEDDIRYDRQIRNSINAKCRSKRLASIKLVR